MFPPYRNSDGHRTRLGNWLLQFMPVVCRYHAVTFAGFAVNSDNGGGVRLGRRVCKISRHGVQWGGGVRLRHCLNC